MVRRLEYSPKCGVNSQEILRIFRNSHRDLEEEVVNGDLTSYMKKLQNSGYSREYRVEVLKSGRKAWSEMKKADSRGEKPIYRPRGWREGEREEKKRNKIDSWYKTGGYESMMFVPATPGAELRKEIQEEMDKLQMKVKIVEKPGEKLVNVMKQNVKRERVLCGETDCMICKSEKGGSCTKAGPVYGIYCKE